MRILFAGTPDFSVPALRALVAEGHDVVAVYTQPDRQSGRGMHTRVSPVKHCALELGLTVLQPTTLKHATEKMNSFSADILIVVAYGLILPPDLLQIPKHGCLNIHASLLPRWRGAAPIHRAIEAGDAETGITIMQMDEGLDTGDILSQFPTEITSTDTGQQLHDRLANLGSTAIIDALSNLDDYQNNASAQENALSCYAKKISKQESNIDWSEECELIQRRIRAFNPWPGTQSWYKGTRLRITESTCSNESSTSKAGTVLSADKAGIRIACGKGVLDIKKLQRPGGKILSSAVFLNGMQIDAGTMLTRDNE